MYYYELKGLLYLYDKSKGINKRAIRQLILSKLETMIIKNKKGGLNDKIEMRIIYENVLDYMLISDINNKYVII